MNGRMQIKIGVPPEKNDDQDVNGLFVMFSCMADKEDWLIAKEGGRFKEDFLSPKVEDLWVYKCWWERARTEVEGTKEEGDARSQVKA